MHKQINIRTISKTFTSYTTVSIKIHTVEHHEGARSVKVGLMMVARATETCNH